MAKSTDNQTTFYPNATAKCTNCGSQYQLGSTLETLSVEICGNCHPFYTGKAILVDTAGRIEKFQSKLSKVITTEKSAKSKVRKQVQSISDLILEDAEAEESKPKTVKTAKPKPTPSGDDLTKIEGIGPKIAQLLVDNGYSTYSLLAGSDVEALSVLLNDNGLASHKPETWSKQALMASESKWEELKTWQDELNGGKE